MEEKDKNKNKGGRPKADKKRKNQTIRYSDDEWKDILKISKNQNMKPASYVRVSSLEGVKGIEEFKLLQELTLLRKEINKIGINFNQIAFKVNATVIKNGFGREDKIIIENLGIKILELFSFLRIELRKRKY